MGNWQLALPESYRLICEIIQEPDGRYSISCLNLPGVASQGDTKQEAISNIEEAFNAVLDSYEADGTEIPWVEVINPRGMTNVIVARNQP